MKRNTIFKQLILNIIIPVAIALSVLAVVNQWLLYTTEIKNEAAKKELVSEEIKNILEFQNVALDLIESNLTSKIEDYSHRLIHEYFRNTEGIKNANLYDIRDELGLNPKLFDFYIINNQGVIVNTTFKKDLGLDFFSFGQEHKDKLLKIFKDGVFVSDRFATEVNTKQLKKYSYQPTLDKKYLIEIGMYSEEAFNIYEMFVKRLKTISAASDIQSIDLFVNKEKPFSVNSDAAVNEAHLPTITKVFEDMNTQTITSKEDGKTIEYQYIYLGFENAKSSYKNAVIRIISDRTNAHAILKDLLIFTFLLLIVTILVMGGFFYRKIKQITSPINNLVEKSQKITEGNLQERVDVVGNNEITILSEQFNLMVKNLEHSYFEIVEQKKDLEDSIRYAKRIQNAILPPEKLRREILPNSFVLYKPKDIVSGDFYWIDHKDNKSLFSVVDCTGHGVPGAFMSIVGYNGLNRAVGDHNLSAPNEILDDLNNSVTGSLRQQHEDGVKDGMDLALCSIDYTNNILQYAGANNPLYIIRKNGNDPIENKEPSLVNEEYSLFEFKANKQPIGSHLERTKFTSHTIKLCEDDCIYIFSDGFADQFGGTNGKKFKYKPFKQLLMANQHQAMDIQREILDEAIENWKGSLEQIDDICVIGVKV